MDGTIIQQGRFTADGNSRFIELRSDVDWMKVYNYTILEAGGAGTGAQFYWQRGFAADAALEYIKLAADDSLTGDVITSGGFTLLDSSNPPIGALNTTVTAVSAAATPVVSATSTAGLVNGDVVRMIDVTGAQQLGGIEFEIDNVVANTSFDLTYMAQIVAGTTGSFREVFLFPQIPNTSSTPRPKFISAITQAASAVVTLTVTHGYEVGSVIRMEVPAAYGMVEMNDRQATITAVDTANNTITINVDSTGFTAFAFPLTADVPFSPAFTVPIGTTQNDSSAVAQNSLRLGINLAAGTHSPAGVTSDVIYWVAGKSFHVDNE